jgi:hypothetical protein
MAATVIDRQEASVTIQIRISLSRSLLDTEEAIQTALNDAGALATAEALQQFDTDGSPLEMGSTRWYSKGQELKTYQTPYGEVVVPRHVYQTAQGGPTFCPLERDARIILTSTPRFARQVSHKYAEMSSGRVSEDLASNHGRKVARSFVQDLAEVVGSVAQAKEASWHYQTPPLDRAVATLGIGLDGTCMLMAQEGYRQAMVGTVTLYAAGGERLHTIYVAATPEYGKATFQQRLRREIDHARGLYPEALVTGVADGAADNWEFLGGYTADQVIDFYHAVPYLRLAAKAANPRSVQGRERWLDERRHRLKHEVGAAGALLAELQGLATAGLGEEVRAGLQEAITYFTNHQHQMGYAERLARKVPIGSGVTEAACKTIVKQRLCKSGQKWKEQGAAVVLSLRTLSYTAERWEQFWGKLDRYGFPVAA